MNISTEELNALAEVAKGEGRNWKSRLREMWTNGSYNRYGYGEIDCYLQSLRNRLGPSWLVKFQFPCPQCGDDRGKDHGCTSWHRSVGAPTT